ncbi:MAG: hypothetical protein CVV11_13665 [Gammaproteobacteria bacterium HGW-Gammaproteobacteria-15]|nr:MAG: hypothetical protein CVV11_13665 [Gammaproteobacteria bacterium HGW-Gammaproteobacteria-15]
MRTSNVWRKPLPLLAAALSFLVFIVFSQQVNADMFSWFKKKELQLSPTVQGQILLHGQPVKGITVLRDLNYGDELYTDRQVTGSDGHFSFPAKNIRVKDSMFDTDVRHGLFVEQGSEITRIFSISNLNTLDFKSFNTLLKNMTCELSNPELGYDLEPDPAKPGVYLGAISKCSFADESVVTNKEIVE